MGLVTLKLFLIALSFSTISDAEILPNQPQQIHLSLGNSHSEMVVTWTTYVKQSSIVHYGVNQNKLNQRATGSVTEFVDNGKRVHYIHRVVLQNLKPFTTYYYICGSQNSWSKLISFRTLSDDTNWSPKMLVFGDLGLENGATIPYMKEEVDNGTVNLAFHNGDFGYDLGHENSHIGDKFMRTMEPIASRLAYQTSPGNHETYDKEHLDNYVHRFTMFDMTSPRAIKSDHYYAFYLGPALIISINNEVYIEGTYSDNLPANLKTEQEAWLKNLLEDANKPENRKRYPWIIILGHQPMYCNSCPNEDCCRREADAIRENLEEILYHYGVDIAIWAHVHLYERMWPVYRSKPYVDNIETPYKNSKVPIHLITGSAGNIEYIDYQFFPAHSYNAFGNSQYGYGILEIVNSTNLVFKHKAIIEGTTDSKGKLHVIDQIDIVQEYHGIRSPIN